MTEDDEQPSTADEEAKTVTVLYGSHGGTAEETAEALYQELTTRFSTSSVVGPTALDDFMESPQWTSVVVIVVSSFGMGHAPRNARRFRKLCDHWTETLLRDDGKDKPLHGVRFALLRLGSSLYSTYQGNPTSVYNGLIAAGARSIGEKGAVDSSGGPAPQRQQILEWQNALMEPLRTALSAAGPEDRVLSMEMLQEMNARTALP